MPPRLTKLLRAGGLVIAIAGFAAAGLWAGRLVRGNARTTSTEAPTPGLAPGEAFPSVAVVDEDGTPHATRDLVADGGAVVLFLDFECEPCAVMVSRWERLAAEDSLRDVRRIGVTLSPPRVVREYRTMHGVSFPIYSDTAAAFVRLHGVSHFPLCVAVDGAGTVRWATLDADAAVPAGEIRRWVTP